MDDRERAQEDIEANLAAGAVGEYLSGDDALGPCIEWDKYKRPDGYGGAWLNGKKVLAHRVSYAMANGLSLEDISGLVIRHRCDNPPCIRPDHLELGTQADNVADRMKRGRHRTGVSLGEMHGCSKLTAAQVMEIRERYLPRHNKNGTRAMAREFGVHQATISRIIRNKNWRTV